MMTRYLKKNLVVSLILIMALSCIPYSANAVSEIDQNRPVSLQIDCKYNGHPIDGMQFELYYVANILSDNTYQLAGDFINYPIQLNHLDTSDWRALTQTLVYYTQADGITPLGINKTNQAGTVAFPTEGKSLLPGLYLVKSTPCVVGNYTYYSESFLICLPTKNLTSGGWEYDVVVQAKCSTDTPSYDTVDRKVLKIWTDENANPLPKDLYPEKTVVNLWKNEILYDSVTLNEANNWQHIWKDLPKHDENGVKIEWGVTEDPIAGYTVSVSLEQTTFIVTNKLAGDSPVNPDDTSNTIRRVVKKTWDDKGYEKQRPNSINVQLMRNGAVYETVTLNNENSWQYTWSDLQAKDDNGNEIQWTVTEVDVPGYVVSIEQYGDTFLLTNAPVKPSLPQTGVLWWPVPVFAATGLLFVLLGHILRGRSRDA